MDYRVETASKKRRCKICRTDILPGETHLATYRRGSANNPIMCRDNFCQKCAIPQLTLAELHLQKIRQQLVNKNLGVYDSITEDYLVLTPIKVKDDKGRNISITF